MQALKKYFLAFSVTKCRIIHGKDPKCFFYFSHLPEGKYDWYKVFLMEVETLNQIFLKFNYCLYHIKSWGSKKVVLELSPNEFESWEVCLLIKGRNGIIECRQVPHYKETLCYTMEFQLDITSDNDSSRKLKGRMIWSDVNFTELLWKA